MPAPYIPDTSLEMYQKKLLAWVWIPNRSIYDVAKQLKRKKEVPKHQTGQGGTHQQNAD